MLQFYRSYLSLGLYSITKPVLDKIKKNGRESKKNSQPAEYCYSRWHNIQADIMQTIIKRLKGPDLVRMGCVCKSWKEILVLHKDVWITAPDVPWLLLPRASDKKCLSFYSMSEGRVYNTKLPKTAQGGRVCGYSKGWLAVVKGSDLCPHMFLLNPISGEQIDLPSLLTVDLYDDHLKNNYNSLSFVSRIEVFSSLGTPESTVVAAIFGFSEVLAFCKLGDEQWTIFEGGGVEDEEEASYLDILFYKKTLCAIYHADPGVESVSTHTIFLTDCALLLKLIPCQVNLNLEVWEEIENQPGLFADNETVSDIYLVESIHGELLKIHHIQDTVAIDSRLLEDDRLNDKEEGEGEWDGEGEGAYLPLHCLFYKTKGFEIFKVNPNSGQMEKLTSLGNQVLFLSAFGGSLSLPVRNMDGYGRNCIYFPAVQLRDFDQHYNNMSQDSGVFYLEDGRIERSFPSCSFSMHSRITWFAPFSK